MNYNKGDLVIVCTGRDEGDIGIVIGKVAWYDGAHKMLVVLSEGKKKSWYVELFEDLLYSIYLFIVIAHHF